MPLNIQILNRFEPKPHSRGKISRFANKIAMIIADTQTRIQRAVLIIDQKFRRDFLQLPGTEKNSDRNDRWCYGIERERDSILRFQKDRGD